MALSRNSSFRSDSGDEGTEGHTAIGPLVVAEGIAYNSDTWKGWPFYRRWASTRTVRNRILSKDADEWSPEEMAVITSRPGLYNFVNSAKFEIVLTGVIVVNTFVMGLRIDDAKSNDRMFYKVAEHVFTAIYLMEWICNMLAEGFVWLSYCQNAFDTLVVFGAGVFPAWVLPVLNITNLAMSGGMYTIFRVMRILRITRLMRMAKQRDLWMLMIGIAASLKSFMWAMVILTSFFYVCAIFLRAVIEYEGEGFLDPHIDSNGQSQDLQSTFGNVPSVMWFLFTAMTNGMSWAPITDPIIARAPIFYIYFMSSICICQFVLGNLITAVIVEHAIGNAHLDAEAEAHEADKVRQKTLQQIIDLYRDADNDGNGIVDRKEFQSMLKNRKMKRLMRVLELDDSGYEMMDLFDMCDVNDDGEISMEEYQTIFFKIMRPPSSKDILRILAMLERVDHKVESILGLDELPVEERNQPWRGQAQAVKKRKSMQCDAGDTAGTVLEGSKELVVPPRLPELDPQSLASINEGVAAISKDILTLQQGFDLYFRDLRNELSEVKQRLPEPRFQMQPPQPAFIARGPECSPFRCAVTPGMQTPPSVIAPSHGAFGTFTKVTEFPNSVQASNGFMDQRLAEPKNACEQAVGA